MGVENFKTMQSHPAPASLTCFPGKQRIVANKVCTRCRQAKPVPCVAAHGAALAVSCLGPCSLLLVVSLEEFPRNRRAHMGRSSRCRECHRQAVRDWRERNRDRENAERRAAYREAHPLSSRACVVCGQEFVHRPDAIVCGAECRRERKIEQRRALREKGR